MKIAAYNLNSINARIENLTAWLAKAAPDVVLVQEIKSEYNNFPFFELRAAGYEAKMLGQKSYNGVAVLSRHPLSVVREGLPDFDDENARYLETEVSVQGQKWRLASIYLPNGNPVTREALCYGAAAAAMFAAVILWFQCCNAVMTADKYLYVFGSVLPGVSLLLSMALRFVPKFTAHMRAVAAAQASLGCGTREGSAWQRLRNGARVLSVTVSWALGITAADSMKSRGYGAGRRTYFGNYRFTRRDGLLSAVLVLALAGVCVGIGRGALYVRYYPSIHIGSAGALGAVCAACFALLCFLPLLLDGKEALTWRRLRSNI